MTRIDDLNKLLQWKLLKGSHKFPGSDGGTCISEAAVVAAGFEYRSIHEARDCPVCFSRVIATYAIGLNDVMPDDLRQELLMPFVTRLAGTKDTLEVEMKRASYIAVQTIKRILPISLRGFGILEDCVRLCEGVSDLDAAHAYATAAATAARRRAAADAAVTSAHYDTSSAHGVERAATAAADAANYAADAAGRYYAAYYAAEAIAEASVWSTDKIFAIAVAILNEAINLGNQAAPAETALVVARMRRQKELATG